MKINEITNREKATQVISLPPSAINIDEFLQEKCPIAYNSPLKIYRGFKRNESLMYIDSSKYERKSANTNNIYTLLLSEILPNWSMYPKRNKSFICSTDKGYAGSYGAQHDEAANYKVYPLGDPTIGICSDYDIWDCFRRNFNLLNMNNEVLPYIFKSAGSIKPIPKTKYDLINNIDLPVYYNKYTKTTNSAANWNKFNFNIDINNNPIRLNVGSILEIPIDANSNLVYNSISSGDTISLNNFTIGTSSIIDFSGQYTINSVGLTNSYIYLDISSNTSLVSYGVSSSLPLIFNDNSNYLLSNNPYLGLNKGVKYKITRIDETNSSSINDRYLIETEKM